MMYNLSSKKKLWKYKILESRFSQAKGLMFTKQKNFKQALVFPRPFSGRLSSSVHMFFVFFRIDVLFLDDFKKVVDIKKGLRPFFFYFPKKDSKYIIEVPYGYLSKSKLKIGDKLLFR